MPKAAKRLCSQGGLHEASETYSLQDSRRAYEELNHGCMFRNSSAIMFLAKLEKFQFL